jgi:(2Fe-2S) ferredoxin
MRNPQYRFVLCNGAGARGGRRGACHRMGAADLVTYLEREVARRRVDAIVATTRCMNACEQGPILVVYPNEIWYYGVTQRKLDEILDGLTQRDASTTLLTA